MADWLKSKIRQAEGLIEVVDELATQYMNRTKDDGAASEEKVQTDTTESLTEGREEDSKWLALCEELKRRLSGAHREMEGLRGRLREVEQCRIEELEERERISGDLRHVQNDKHQLEATLQAEIVAQRMAFVKIQSESNKWREKAVGAETAWRNLSAKLQAEKTFREEENTHAIDGHRKVVEELEAAVRREKQAHMNAVASSEEREEELQQQLGLSAEHYTALQKQLETKNETLTQIEEEWTLLKLREQRGYDDKEAPEGNRLVTELSQEVETLQRQLQTEIRLRTKLTQKLSSLQSELETARSQKGKGEDVVSLKAQLYEVQELLCEKQLQVEKVTAHAASLEVFHDGQKRNLQDRIDQLTSKSETAVTIADTPKRFSPFSQSVISMLTLADRQTSHLMNLIRRSPIARITACLYLVSMHLYLYVLLTRIQTISVKTTVGHSDVE